MPDLSPLVIIGALIFSLMNLVRWVLARDWSPVINQVAAYVVGLLVIVLVRGSSLAKTFEVAPGHTLASLNTYDVIVIGLLATSIFSPVVQAIKAIDRSQSAFVPSLFKPAPAPTVVTTATVAPAPPAAG